MYFILFFHDVKTKVCVCVCRVSSREDRTPTQYARQLLRQDHTHHHGGSIYCCYTFQSHREYCECVFMYHPCPLFVLPSGFLSVSTLVCLRRLWVIDQCLQQPRLVSRWTRANLKLIYFKYRNWTFDVWRQHIMHRHIFSLFNTLPCAHFLHPVWFSFFIAFHTE